METETVASRNVVDLMLNEEFAASICGPRITGPSPMKVEKADGDKGFVFGWDC
jgi:prenylcysteine oxidase / farnesylcysteine lyase